MNLRTHVHLGPRLRISAATSALLMCLHGAYRTGAHPRGCCRAAASPNPSKPKFKRRIFCRYYDIKSFTWFPLQPKLATEIGWWLLHWNFEKKIKKKDKKTGHCDWVTEHLVIFVCMYIKAVAGSVMLCLQHDYYNIVFKIKHKLYIVSGSAPPPPRRKILAAHLIQDNFRFLAHTSSYTLSLTAKFQVLTVTLTEFQLFWSVTLRQMANSYRRFVEASGLHLQSHAVLKKRVTDSKVVVIALLWNVG
jgi:hypothetical protein